MDPHGTYVWSPQISPHSKSLSRYIWMAKTNTNVQKKKKKKKSYSLWGKQIGHFLFHFLSGYLYMMPVGFLNRWSQTILAGTTTGKFCSLSVVWYEDNCDICRTFWTQWCSSKLVFLEDTNVLEDPAELTWQSVLLQPNSCVFNRTTRLSVSFHRKFNNDFIHFVSVLRDRKFNSRKAIPDYDS